MIMFVGQVERAVRGREAFQELDYRAVFGSHDQMGRRDRRRRTASPRSSRAPSTPPAPAGPGRWCWPCRKDMLTRAGRRSPTRRRVRAGRDRARRAEMAALAALLAEAPSGPCSCSAAAAGTRPPAPPCIRFAERFDLPVATSYRRAPLFDPLHPNYAGDLGLAANPALIARMQGGRPGHRRRRPAQRDHRPGLQPVRHPRRRSAAGPRLSRVPRSSAGSTRPHLAIHATPHRFAAALDALEPRPPMRRGAARPPQPTPTIWPGRRRRRRSPARSTSARSWSGCASTCRTTPSSATAPATTPPGSTASTASAASARHIAPTSASMGYGVPAAVAMQRLLSRARRVVSINGDGDFLMNGQEFATAVQYDLPIIVLVFDNGIYGTIRMHQEREYPGRVIGHRPEEPRLRRLRPRLRRLRRHGGAHGRFRRRLSGGPGSGLPAIIHVKFDPGRASRRRRR